MKTITLGVIAAAALAASGATAQAQYYPWCLVISDKTGSWSCYFETREQCLASAGGNVGFCARNPAVPDRQPRRKSLG